MSVDVERPGLHKGVGHNIPTAPTPVERLAEGMLWLLRTSDTDSPVSGYYGRSAPATVAHGRAIVSYYNQVSLSAREMVLVAATTAVNNRLKIDLKQRVRVTDVDLLEVQPKDNTDPVRRRGEPMPLYLARLKSWDAATDYMDANPVTSYKTMDEFLALNPGRAALRQAGGVVEYLATLEDLDEDRRLMLGGAYAMMAERAGFTTPQAVVPFSVDQLTQVG